MSGKDRLVAVVTLLDCALHPWVCSVGFVFPFLSFFVVEREGFQLDVVLVEAVLCLSVYCALCYDPFFLYSCLCCWVSESIVCPPSTNTMCHCCPQKHRTYDEELMLDRSLSISVVLLISMKNTTLSADIAAQSFLFQFFFQSHQLSWWRNSEMFAGLMAQTFPWKMWKVFHISWLN